jgi:hypothetical protein
VKLAAVAALFLVGCGAASHDVAPVAVVAASPAKPSRGSPPAASREPLSVTATATSAGEDGVSGEVLVTLAVAPGFHVMSNRPGKAYYIPTTIMVYSRAAADLTLGEPAYPDGKPFQSGTESLSIFDGTVVVRVPFEAKSSAAPGTRHVRGVVRYQACTAGRCLAPRSVRFEAVVDARGPDVTHAY